MGEGYGGVQVPNIMAQISDIKVEGIILGNPITNYRYDGLPAQVDLALARGQIDDELHEDINDFCDLAYYNIYGSVSEQCMRVLDKFFFYTNLTNQFDMYTKCFPNQTVRCLWSKEATDYFNTPLVKQQLHINESSSWTACNDGSKYERSVFGSQWTYKDILQKGYKVLVYSGNSDSLVPTVGTERWIQELKLTVTKEWAPYFMMVSLTNKQIVGYLEAYGNLTFATVHGAGHMTMRAKSVQTLHLLYNFMNNSLL